MSKSVLQRDGGSGERDRRQRVRGPPTDVRDLVCDASEFHAGQGGGVASVATKLGLYSAYHGSQPRSPTDTVSASNRPFKTGKENGIVSSVRKRTVG